MRVLRTSAFIFTLGLAMNAIAQSPTVATTIAVVEAEYANILLDADPDELRELGLTAGTKFTFTHGGRSYTATLVEEYGDVEQGEWLGRMWEQRVELAISFGNACTELSCKVGDTVTITAIGAK